MFKSKRRDKSKGREEVLNDSIVFLVTLSSSHSLQIPQSKGKRKAN